MMAWISAFLRQGGSGLVFIWLAVDGDVQELVELGAQPDQVTERGGVHVPR
jgi:hypothetical protein